MVLLHLLWLVVVTVVGYWIMVTIFCGWMWLAVKIGKRNGLLGFVLFWAPAVALWLWHSGQVASGAIDPDPPTAFGQQ